MMEAEDHKNLSISRWVKATFLGWFLGFILVLILASALDAVGISGLQFFLGVGMAGGVGFTQWHVLKKVTSINKKWIWYSVLGMGVPFFVFDMISLFSEFSLGTYYLPVSIGVGGIAVGFLQQSLLKDISQKSGIWILASFLGWLAAALCVLSIDYVKFVVSHNMIGFFINIFMILAGGVVLGFITGYYLKKMLG